MQLKFPTLNFVLPSCMPGAYLYVDIIYEYVVALCTGIRGVRCFNIQRNVLTSSIHLEILSARVLVLLSSSRWTEAVTYDNGVGIQNGGAETSGLRPRQRALICFADTSTL